MKSFVLSLVVVLACSNVYASGVAEKATSKGAKKTAVKSRGPASVTSKISSFVHNLWEGNVQTDSDWKDEDSDIENSYVEVIRSDFKSNSKDPENPIWQGLRELENCSVKFGDDPVNRKVHQKDFYVVNVPRGTNINADDHWGSGGINIRINRKLKIVRFHYDERIEDYKFNDSMTNLIEARAVDCNKVRCEVIKCKLD